ncbi:hypothetical protein Tco_0908962 [Tanacetum coccineum]|uniref:CYTH domain-containing protein n=1 Tax=Tanacetum coccineum TaxID=301880 RepID=A0ABQ5CQP9_9ASTR
MKHQTNAVVAAARNSLTEAYKKLKAAVAATATDTPGFVVYPMYKAFIEPDLKTAHIRIMNKFNPLTGFQSLTYIFKSSRNITDDQVKFVMSDEHTQTLEETYDIYLLPPGADLETCESYLRIRNREYSLMFEVVVADIKRVPNRLHTELFVTDGICKVMRTSIAEVLAIIPQTQKAKLMEAYKNKIVPKKSEPSICVPPSIICWKYRFNASFSFVFMYVGERLYKVVGGT